MPRALVPFSAAPLALVLVLALALVARSAAAQEIDGRGIMDKADKVNRARDERNQVTMTIYSPRGERRRRALTTYFKSGEGDDDRALVRFESPADVKGTGLLTIEHGESDDQWLFLPDLRKSKRIAGATKAQSFMGTDFSNYDMRTEDLAGHVYEKKGEEEAGGRACWLVEARPKDESVAEATGYSLRRLRVDKERWVVPKVEYFDRNGKLLKVAESDGFKQVDGLWRPATVTMENKQEGSKTVIAFGRRAINEGIDDDVFTKRTLENP